MKVGDKYYRTIWLTEDEKAVNIIDQRFLPHKFVIEKLRTTEDFIVAIRDMHVRGAGLIGVTAAYGMYIASLEGMQMKDFNDYLTEAGKKIKATRPTAVNLSWAVDKMLEEIFKEKINENKVKKALNTANEIMLEDIEISRKIGEHGVKLIEEISRKKSGEVVNVLTHCNAGWLAFVDYGTATSPIYAAFEKGIKIHVWVDETRPRNQGASLTAWELENCGIPYTIIVDNAGGHLMQNGMVDIVIVGTDRTTSTGDVANKTGTYLKALAAKDNNVPFYVALPTTSIDWNISDGIREIIIEQRGDEEVKYISGLAEDGTIKKVLITPANSNTANYGFDITPARLITGLITEKGVIQANKESLEKIRNQTN
ncbi:MAG: S-methyl-5-thioribose-1-phosphate isomerase [Bacteroidota bacterium]|nr:S-methyl-5-thioribose-1-phosphate isomerase [Bacteroidota bacterium]